MRSETFDRNSTLLLDSVFAHDPMLGLFRGMGKTRATLALNRTDTPLWLAKGGWK